MKKLLIILAVLALLFLSLGTALGQSSVYNATTYAYTTQVTQGNSSTGTSSVGAVPTAFAPFNANASITLNRNASNQETVSLTSVTNCYQGSINCTLAGSFTYTHVAGETIQSGTYGLQEAINAALTAGAGTVLVDSTWGGPAGSALITAAKGSTVVVVEDIRAGAPTFYQWSAVSSAYGLASLAPGSSVLPAQAGRVPVATATMPRSGWTAYHADGDSITAGNDSTATANRYVNLIDTAVGSPALTNNAVAGSFGCDVTNRVFNDENPGSSSTTLETIAAGVNDAVNGGATGGPGAYEAVFNLCHMATLSWLTIPSTLKYTGASFGSLPTNWTADNTYSQVEGIQATAYNASATFPYTTTVAGQQVFVWYRVINGGTGAFGLTDSGGAPSQSVTSFTSPGVIAQSYSQSVGVAVLYNKTRAAGTYSVTVTVNSINSGTVSILGVGVAPPAITATTPTVWVGGVTRLIGDWQQAATTAYDRDVQADVALLDSYSLAVYYVNTPNYFMSVAGQDMSGNQGTAATSNCIMDTSGYWIHPCNTGHQEIANAFLAPTATPNYQAAAQYGQGTIYQAPVSLNQILATQGNPGTSVWFDDKYVATNVQAVAIGGASVGPTNCAATGGMTLDGNHPGLVTIVSGAASSEGVVCITNNNGVQTLTGLQTPWRPWYYETQVNFPVLPGTTAHAYQVGLTNSAAVNPWTSSEAFYLSSANANANHFYCEYNSGPTLVDSGVSAVAGSWYKLTITDDGNLLRFFINGAQVCGSIVAANATAGNSFIAASSVALTGTSEYMIQDYELFQISGLQR